MAENDWEIRVELDATPLLRQDYAYPQVALAFGFNEEMIEALVGTNTHYYWSALTEGTASCVTEGPNGEMSVMSVENVRRLHDMANQDNTNAEAHRFLVNFTGHALLLRQRLRKSMDKFASADDFFETALEAFFALDHTDLTKKQRKNLSSFHHQELGAWDREFEGLEPGFEFALTVAEIDEDLYDEDAMLDDFNQD